MQPEDIDETTPTVEIPVAAPEFLKPEPERDPFWGYRDLLLMIGLVATSVIITMLGAAIWVHFEPGLEKDQIALALPIQFVLYFFVYLCFVAVFKLKYGRGVFESLKWRKTNHSLLAAGAGGVLLAFGLSAMASLVHTPKIDTPFEQLVKTPLSLVLLAITAVFVAPLFEEMVFRGFLQPLLSRTLGVAWGILITAALFGGLHLPEYQGVWQYGAAIALVGVALGVVRAKTDSIIPPTVMHGCFNAVSVVGLVASKYFIHK